MLVDVREYDALLERLELLFGSSSRRARFLDVAPPRARHPRTA